MEISRFLIRLAVIMLFIGFGILLVIDLCDLYSLVLGLQENNLIIRGLLALIGVLTSLSIFYVWGAMLWHWKNNKILSQFIRMFWVLFMIFGMFIGAIAYFFFVYNKEENN